MRALIVGAGIGGLALALGLARRGIASVVLERAEALCEVGAGVQISPNASLCLRALGVLEAVRALASEPEEVVIRSASNGRRLYAVPLGDLAERRWGAPYLQVHRADLQGALSRAVAAHGQVELRLGAAVVEVDEAAPAVVLASGERLSGDLVVGADGLRSTVRARLGGPKAARFTGRTAWRGLTPAAGLVSELARGAGVLLGRNQHFVHYPVRGGALVNFVAVTHAGGFDAEGWDERGEGGALLSAFQTWPDPASELIRGAGEVGRWALFDRPPLARFSAEAVGVIGDAAHPMAPYLAQGAAMALEDAVVLARCLSLGGTAAQGFAAFDRARRGRTLRVQKTSTFNGRLFHLPPPAARAAFLAAALLDRPRPEGARLDWLYGYDAAEVAL